MNNSAALTVNVDLRSVLHRGDELAVGGTAPSPSEEGSPPGGAIMFRSVHVDNTWTSNALPINETYVGGTLTGLSLYARRNTTALPFDATAADVEAALEALPSVGDVGVERDGPDDVDGYAWTVRFLGRGGKIPTLGVVSDALLGDESRVVVETVVPGGLEDEVQRVTTTIPGTGQ